MQAQVDDVKMFAFQINLPNSTHYTRKTHVIIIPYIISIITLKRSLVLLYLLFIFHHSPTIICYKTVFNTGGSFSFMVRVNFDNNV